MGHPQHCPGNASHSNGRTSKFLEDAHVLILENDYIIFTSLFVLVLLDCSVKIGKLKNNRQQLVMPAIHQVD